jgi:TonB family protein
LTYELGGGPQNWSTRNRFASASLALLLFCLALASVPTVRAQSVEHSSRKVIRMRQPDYPAVLKSKGIGGLVRVNAKVLADGTVASIQIVGGNPILAESVVKSVMKWKYAPAASASNETVTFDFNAH